MSRRVVGGTACRPQPPNQEILGSLWPRQSFSGGPVAKNPPANAEDTEDGVPSLGQKDPWRRKWQPTSIFLPGKSLGQRNLTGYSPQGYERVGRDLASEQNNSNGKPAFCSSGPHLWLDSHSWFLEGTQVFQYNSVWGLGSLSSLRNTLTEKIGEDDNRGAACSQVSTERFLDLNRDGWEESSGTCLQCGADAVTWVCQCSSVIICYWESSYFILNIWGRGWRTKMFWQLKYMPQGTVSNHIFGFSF